jgi:flavin reductase (DIM6/NTAB) family NADH-FMN oxidoreductase RutF
MQRLAGHVTVVTTSDGTVRRGLTATSVCSLTAEPPALVVCVNKETWVGSVLPASNRFCVNVLARHHQELAEVFAGMREVCGEDRFAYGRWRTAATGAPVLEDALAAFDCTVDQVVERSSHLLVIGAVRQVIVGDTADRPLVYVARRFAQVTELSPS